MGERPDQTATEPQPMIDGVLRGFVSRAEELLQSQERMAGLLEAVVAVAEDLSLDAVLERVVQSACRLLHARYGALGVIGDDQALSHFITVGIDQEMAHRIGPLPTGHGVLGLLISDPRPLRLPDLHNHPESYGFPANHPPMKSFLGVPVRVRDVVFGNLYLTEKEDGSDFTAEDEGLAVALAAAAGVAIENARLYDDARRRARWLEACMDVSGLMLSSDRDYTSGGLDPIASRALQESGSQLALLVAPATDGSGHIVAGAAGKRSPQFSGRTLRLDSPLLESVLDGGEPVVLDNASALFGEIDGGITGPLLAVALSTQGAHHGLLLLIRDPNALRYARTDIEMGAVFGSHVALALELARVHRLREELLVFTDRDRIARDLHDLVIQRLFAAGLSVQSLTRFTKDELATERIRNITNELDEAIRSLRDTIYSLKSSSGETELLSGRIRRVTRSSAKSMPFTPRLIITGPVDAVTPDKADNVVAVVSEGLSNAIRHSGADTISVSVGVVKGRVTVVITDNGAGFAEPEKRRGLANLEDRARMLDGECTITSAPDAGTSLEWSVPL
ncbi:GAF domain-containing sensor histidine kinase [Pseudarthrobacter oxydans]|uniref:GAF domain-containing sensor histidine kinase n=1 Tax=Pseudarthrobacter oxydans TaxID=1671 RepID=UPI0027D7DABA|nr:GAF domain-containing sensor histidine kinase [Pseudarthrobacter oxydans]